MTITELFEARDKANKLFNMFNHTVYIRVCVILDSFIVDSFKAYSLDDFKDKIQRAEYFKDCYDELFDKELYLSDDFRVCQYKDACVQFSMIDAKI